jgi:hypothetical protein
MEGKLVMAQFKVRARRNTKYAKRMDRAQVHSIKPTSIY